MDVILGVDAIRPPLTGIGRYALALADRLDADPRIDRLRYFSMLGWVSDPNASLHADDMPKQIGLRLRSIIAQSRLGVRVYEELRPRLVGWRLRSERNAVFHSPNFFLPRFSGISIATVHDLSHVRFPQFHPQARVSLMNIALQRSLAQADYLITDSEFVRSEIIDLFRWPEDRIGAIPLGVDSRFRPAMGSSGVPAPLASLGLRSDGYALFVGTLEPRKNLARLLTAYALLSAEMRQQWPLVVAGDKGWRSADLHVRVRAAEEAGWLRHLNYVDESWLPDLYAHARLFVYPSLYEGFGLPLIEAMASGVPVVTTSVASIPEVVGAAAYTVDPESTEQLQHALTIGLEDESWRTRARAVGLQQALRFTWERCITSTVDAYTKAFDAGGGR